MKIVTTLFPAFLALPLPSLLAQPSSTGRPGWEQSQLRASPTGVLSPAGFSLPAVPLLLGEGERSPRAEQPPGPTPSPAHSASTTGLNKENRNHQKKEKEKQNQTKPFPCKVQTYNSYPRWSIETSMLWEKQVNWKHKSTRDSFKTKKREEKCA